LTVSKSGCVDVKKITLAMSFPTLDAIDTYVGMSFKTTPQANRSAAIVAVNFE
jgi:hypothetical protein